MNKALKHTKKDGNGHHEAVKELVKLLARAAAERDDALFQSAQSDLPAKQRGEQDSK